MRAAPTPVKRQMFSLSQNLCGCDGALEWAAASGGGLHRVEVVHWR